MSTLKGGPNMITDGLVLYLDTSNPRSCITGSQKIYSLSKNQITGSFTGSISSNAIYDTGSIKSLYFNGTNNGILIEPSSDLIFNTGNFNIITWLKTPFTSSGEASGWGPIISKGMSTSANKNSWWLSQTGLNLNRISFLMSNDEGGAFSVNLNSSNINDGWHYISISRSGSIISMSIDINGQLLTTTSTASLSSTSSLSIATNNALVKYTQISIADILIYNRALTPLEILQNYNTTKTKFN